MFFKKLSFCLFLFFVLSFFVSADHACVVSIDSWAHQPSKNYDLSVEVYNDVFSQNDIYYVEITAPKDYSVVSCHQKANWNIIASGNSFCRYETSSLFAISNGSSEFFVVSVLTPSKEKQYKWDLLTRDFWGGDVKSKFDTFVDGTPPSVSFRSPSSHSTFHHGEEIPLVVQASDTNSGLWPTAFVIWNNPFSSVLSKPTYSLIGILQLQGNRFYFQNSFLSGTNCTGDFLKLCGSSSAGSGLLEVWVSDYAMNVRKASLPITYVYP
jgi:hypothetical protein